MAKLWDDTIDTHRRALRDMTLDAAAALVAEHGLASVTMSQIAQRTGIGRATLYRHFPDIDAILTAWHERHINQHLQQLVEVRDRVGEDGDRLEAVLQAYAFLAYEHEGSDLATSLHQSEHIAHAQQHLHELLRDLLGEAARSGKLRDDITAEELANYCLHALTAARTLPSKAAVRRLVSITLDGLRPPAHQPPGPEPTGQPAQVHQARGH